MRNLKKLTIFWALMSVFLLSCQTEESIEPAFEPVPLDEQLRKRPLRVSLETESVDVEEFGEDFGEVSELGPLFQELANVAANISLEQDGGQDFQVDPIIYFAPELDQIEDWDIIDRLGLEKMNLRIVEADDWEMATLDFVKEVRFYLDFTLPEEGQIDRRDQGILLASYNIDKSDELLTDLDRQINLEIDDVAWKDILKTQRTFVIYTELVVQSVPKTTMKISAEVGVYVGLKVGL